jgi:hypothetical protein
VLRIRRVIVSIQYFPQIVRSGGVPFLAGSIPGLFPTDPFLNLTKLVLGHAHAVGNFRNPFSLGFPIGPVGVGEAHQLLNQEKPSPRFRKLSDEVPKARRGLCAEDILDLRSGVGIEAPGIGVLLHQSLFVEIDGVVGNGNERQCFDKRKAVRFIDA